MPVSKEEFFRAIGYNPHSEGQLNFHKSGARFRMPCCGRRYGKSKMASTDLMPELFDGKKMFWIVGPTYDLGEKEFRVLWDELIIKQKFGRDKRVKKTYNKKQGDMYLELPWGARVEVRSATKPDTLVGESLDGVIMSEAAKHDYETFDRFIRPALADKRGWATFPTTPEGHNWYYDMWMHGLDPELPDYECWRFPSWENKVIFPLGREDPEILLLEKTTTPEWFAQEIGADFSSFVGKIYGEFDVETHVADVQYRPEWQNYIFFDFGFVNPLAAIEVMVSPSEDIYIWREHYQANQTLDEHIKFLKQRPQPDGYHLDLCTGDPADPEAVLYLNQYFAPTIAMPECKTNWREGVDLVKKFLQLRQVGEDEWERPIERPKLFVDRSCVATIREFNTYRSKTGTQNADAAEMARKIDDHAMDALRYGLVHLFLLGAQRHLTETVDTRHHPLGESADSGYFTSGVRF